MTTNNIVKVTMAAAGLSVAMVSTVAEQAREAVASRAEAGGRLTIALIPEDATRK